MHYCKKNRARPSFFEVSAWLHTEAFGVQLHTERFGVQLMINLIMIMIMMRL